MYIKSISPLLVLFTFCTIATFAQVPVKSWENLSGPDGGNILQFDTEDGILYALTYGGIYKSENAGETWSFLEGSRNVADRFSKLEVEAGVLYVLTGKSAISRSLDMGATWKTILQKSMLIDSFPAGSSGMIAYGDTILAISASTIFRSTNRGDTWQSTQVPDNYFAQSFKGFAKQGSSILVAHGSTILKSKDGGLSWEHNFTAGFKFADMEVVGSAVYALYDGFPRLLRSYNAGETWDKIDADSIQFGQYNNETSDWITGIDDKIFYGSDYGCIHGGVQMFQSFDAGDNWATSTRNGLRRHALNDLKALPQSLLAGTEQGVFLSQDDAISFQPFHQGMNATVVHSLKKMPNGRWWVNTQQGIFASEDAGQTWDLRFAGELENPCYGWWEQILFTDTRMIRMKYDQYTHVWISDNGGDTWTEIPPTELFWSPEIYASSGIIWMSVGTRLFKMTNAEQTFTEVIPPAEGYIYNLKVAGDRIMLVIGQQRYLSDNQGDTWENMSTTTENGQKVGHPIYIDTESLFALSLPFEDTLLVYNFKEGNWKPYFPVIEGETLNYWEVKMLKTENGLRWMAVRGRGLYYSSLAEPEIWYPFAPALPFHSPTAISMDFSTQELWVGTDGAGIYKTQFQLEQAELPALGFGVFPNPSPGESTLSSQIFYSEKIMLRVFDASGRLLNEEALPPGQVWDINMPYLPTGMYIWQIATSSGTVALKWLKNS